MRILTTVLKEELSRLNKLKEKYELNKSSKNLKYIKGNIDKLERMIEISKDRKENK